MDLISSLPNIAELKRKLLKRLRNPDLFQGARFEAAVAAMMLAAGYDLQFADERGPGKHPEFFATHKRLGSRIAVEAKSRHRSGVLGFRGGRVHTPSDPFDVAGLLAGALSKDPVDPLLVFIELNSARIGTDPGGVEFYQEVNGVWTAAQSQVWATGFPAIGAVFYNDAAPRYLEECLPEGARVNILALWPNSNRHDVDGRPLLQRVARAGGQRLKIPSSFPERRPRHLSKAYSGFSGVFMLKHSVVAQVIPILCGVAVQGTAASRTVRFVERSILLGMLDAKLGAADPAFRHPP